MRFQIERILYVWIYFLISEARANSTNKYTGETFMYSDEKHQVPVFLYKCSATNNFIPQNFFLIPNTLRPPFSEKLLSTLDSYEDQLDSAYNFTLDGTQSWSCGNDSSITTINLQVNNSYVNQSHSVNKKYAYAKHFFTPSGFLKSDSDYFNPRNFCIDRITEEEIQVQICEPKCGEKQSQSCQPKIPLCCPMGFVFQMNVSNPDPKRRGARCAELETISRSDWEPFSFIKSDSEEVTNETKAQIAYETVYSHNYKYQSLGCSKRSIKYPFKISRDLTTDEIKRRSIQIKVLDNGQVLTRLSGNENWAPMNSLDGNDTNFCVDGLFDSSASDRFFRSSENIVIISCKAAENQGKLYSQVYFGALCLSVVILLVIVIVYALVWVDQKVNGWTIAVLSLCQFFWFLLLCISHANGLFGVFMPTLGLPCIAVGVGIHFFNLASFASMTAINFDLWSTIGSMTPVSERSKGKRRFLTYCFFIFSVPLVVVVIALVIEAQFGLFDDTIIRPQYGRQKCLIDDSANLYYVLLPSMILYIMNMVFAVLVVKTLLGIKEVTKRVGKENSTKGYQSESMLFGKLFILLGASWFFELISWLHVKGDLTWYWAIGDLYNILQTIGLFYIFILKKDIKRQLSRRYSIFRCLSKRIDKWDGRMTVMDRRRNATFKTTASTSSTYENSE